MGPSTCVKPLAHALRVDVTGMFTLSLCCNEITAVSLAVGSVNVDLRPCFSNQKKKPNIAVALVAMRV
jgi:hypothetical protein